MFETTFTNNSKQAFDTDFKLGVPGKDGKSAYEIWLSQGNEGTEQDFLDSLKGKNGYTPVKGIDYFDGKDGLDGKDAELVQALGNSEDKAISQRVVTSHLTDHRNRITNLEQELNFTSFVTDDSVAYAKSVPTNALPYAEVNKIGGMTRKCTNLLSYPYADTTKTVNGITFTDNGDGTITANGTATADAMFFLAREMMLKGTYTLAGCAKGGSNVTYFMALGSSVVCDCGNGVSYTYASEISQNIFIRILSGTTVSNLVFKPMLNSGDTVFPHEPYFEGLRLAEVTEIESMGANLTTAKEVYVGADRYLETVVDGRNCIRFTAGATIKKTPVKFKANTQYTVSFYAKNENFNGASTGNDIFTFFYNDGTREFIYGALDDTDWKLYSLTSQSGKTVEYIGIYVREYRAYTYIDTDTFMLNEGTTTLPYSPYTKKTYPISEAVKALDGYGWGINDEVYNYIDFENKQFVKRVGCVDMGTLNWNVQASSRFIGTQLPYPTKNYDTSSRGVGLIDQYDVRAWYMVNDLRVDKTFALYNLSVYVADTSYTDAETFKSAMSGVMLYYELAEPIITDISDILPDGYYIGAEGGGTITMVNEYQYDVPSEITYQLKGVMS